MPPSLTIPQQQAKRLQAELKTLSEYYDTCERTFDNYLGVWSADYAYFKKECGMTPSEPVTKEHPEEDPGPGLEPEEPMPSPEEEEDTGEDSPWAKKLYKKIAMKTHPDRVDSSADPHAMEQLFRNAASAVADGDYATLISIANKLGIELDFGASEIVPILKQATMELRAKLESLEKSLAWSWCENFGNTEQRLGLLVQAFASESLNLPDPVFLASIIEAREAQTE